MENILLTLNIILAIILVLLVMMQMSLQAVMEQDILELESVKNTELIKLLYP